MPKEFLTGNEAVVKGALAAGATLMTGYPITPTTEIIQTWAKEQATDSKLKFLQTEDEMAAGFAMIGAVLAGAKAFTATAGPGNVLMQDAFSMAENLRLPTVAFINQRGGPSTGTVIYSQQELNLTCFGGNGEGLRIVYSASSCQEMYDYSIKAFDTAWRYRFPTFVLSDGYSAKTTVEIELKTPVDLGVEPLDVKPYFLTDNQNSVNLRNCYNLESELHHVIMKSNEAYSAVTPELIEYEDYKTLDAEIVIFAHGIVGAAAKIAVDQLRAEGFKLGLFRPITLSPFPKNSARQILPNKKAILIAESSLGQFERLLKNNLYGETIPIKTLLKPAMGISVEDIVKSIRDLAKEVK